MADFSRHTGLLNCTCAECALITCGAIDRHWDGWSWVELAGYSRGLMMLLTRQEPVLYAGPRRRWEGCLDWFTTLGLPLDFDDADGEADEPMA
jgi:hypothetical protein